MQLYPTKPWFRNPLSQKILKEKYLYDDETSHDNLINRITENLSEPLQEPVAQLMHTGSFFPGGRSLYGVGSKGKFNATTANCFIVKSPSDSLDEPNGIFDINRKIAQIFKAGGGVGINLSTLRPNGAKTHNAARTSTGAVSFMHIYDATGAVIGYHGRRSAILIGLNISHPDIEEFVNLRETHAMKSMNISCLVDDAFMEALKKDDDSYELHFYVEATGEDIRKTIHARELFHRISEMNWDYGDPGMIFIDTVRQYNLQQYNKDFHIDICNPCGEYMGPAWNSCNLGSLNLYNFVDKKFTDEAVFDFGSFREAVDIAVRTLDEILDYGFDLQPLDENRQNIRDWRSIGLGFFGLADMFIAMKMRYGDEASVKLTSQVTQVMLQSAIQTSIELAKEKGTFDKCDREAILKSDIMTGLNYNDGYDLRDGIEKYGMRNSQLMSIAPTGSLSMLAGNLSSGIEPVFKASYERTTHGLEDRGITFNYSDRAISDLLEFHGIEESLSSEEIKKRFPWVVEAADIDPMDRINVQAVIQEHCDNAISSTVNLPEEATVEEVEKIYQHAFDSGLKGITVFRNNCKRMSILGVKKNKTPEEIKRERVQFEKEMEKMKEAHKREMNDLDFMIELAKQRRESLKDAYYVHMDSLLPIVHRNTIEKPMEGSTYLKHTACVKSMYITVNHDDEGNIFEVFTNKSINGCTANIATITRLVSMALRSGIKVSKIIEELKENTCQACLAVINEHPEKNLSRSCPIAVAEAIEAEYKKLHPDKKASKGEDENMLECPKCHHHTLIPQGKCCSCYLCGYSKCD